MNVQAVIFDRDQTLVYLAPAQFRQLQARLQLLAPRLEPALLRAAWERWSGPWPQTCAEEPAFWTAFATALLTDDGAGDASGLATELATLYHTAATAYDDVQPALDALRAAGLRLAVLSNFELPSVATPLISAGIDPAQFELLVSAAHSHPKPDPRAYKSVAARLGLAPEACCFVDDLAENIEGARLVGMRAYRIERAGPADPAGGVIGSLLDLIGLLPATTAAPGSSPLFSNSYECAP